MNSKEEKKQAGQSGWHMDFESTWNQAQMSFCKMWNRLRSELTKESTRVEIGGVAITEVNKILLDMARIEAEEFNDSVAAMYSATYEKKQYINGDEEYKIANGGKLAREVFEQITGHKVIDSLEELESEIRKRKGKTLLSDVREPVVVDEKVEIPDYIRNEAEAHEIRIARFGVEVISTDELPKGVFMQKMTSPGRFPGF